MGASVWVLAAVLLSQLPANVLEKVTEVGDSHGISGFWIQSGPAAAIMAVLKVNRG